MNKALLAFSFLTVFSLQSMEMEKENKSQVLKVRMEELQASIKTQEEKDELFCTTIKDGEFEVAQKFFEENPISLNSIIIQEFMCDAIENEYDTSPAINFLLKIGVNPNYILENMCSPLYRAAQLGKSKIVKLLLDKNASVHLGNAQGEKPVFAAAINKQYAVVQLLLEKDRLAIPNVLCHVLEYNNNEYVPMIKTLDEMTEKYKIAKK